ncbi:class I SAM-dependent methyltransferase [Halohasta salina]|uniref:class I SAM-dependent methyltransferase n=1 Tax=Halohasta salina TaxID=2961621 RepID=UPI0020A36B71|nr:class I SAM-dependent methyltransferase [Halohasta salina]
MTKSNEPVKKAISTLSNSPFESAVGYLKNDVPMWITYLWADSYIEGSRWYQEFRCHRDGPIPAGSSSDLKTAQFEFFKDQGLSQTDAMLDIGCGCLFAGESFIDYLNPENYYGMDISPSLIKAGKQRLGESTMREKKPSLFVNADLKFDEFYADKKFDYINCQSVWTHMPRELIQECLDNIGSVMHDESVFYPTFTEQPIDRPIETQPYNYAYYPEELIRMAEDAGLSATQLDVEYPNEWASVLEITLSE